MLYTLYIAHITQCSAPMAVYPSTHYTRQYNKNPLSCVWLCLLYTVQAVECICKNVGKIYVILSLKLKVWQAKEKRRNIIQSDLVDFNFRNYW